MNEFIEETPSHESEPPTDESAEKIEEIGQPISAPDRRSPIILRNILRWTLISLIAFGLGVLTLYFTSLKPTNSELEQTKVDLEEANLIIEDLEDQLNTLNQDNQEYENQIESAELRLILLSAISDVRAANLATQDDNYAGALLSLKDASQTLEVLKNTLGEENSEIITTMQENLADIQSALKNEPETAKTDLDRLTTNLLRLERAILK